jgi:16S rRNA processing protein RimM
VVVGRIVKAHGLKGEVQVEPMTEHDERFAVGRTLVLAPDADGEGVEVSIVASRRHKQRWLLKLDWIDDRTHAEQRAGYYLLIPYDEAVQARAEDEFFLHALVGCEVRDETGRSFGDVISVIESDGPVLLEIGEPGGRRRFLPFVEAFVRQVDATTIVVSPPEGWEEL